MNILSKSKYHNLEKQIKKLFYKDNKRNKVLKYIVLSSYLLVVILCMGPKAKATTVQVRQMTLYGMLKSGVGNDTSKI